MLQDPRKGYDRLIAYYKRTNKRVFGPRRKERSVPYILVRIRFVQNMQLNMDQKMGIQLKIRI